MDKIYTGIAGYKILIKFDRNLWSNKNFDFVKERLRDEIKIYCKNFIVPPFKKPNFTIQIAYILIQKPDIKRGNKYYSFFYKRGKNKVITSYQISIFQFQTLMYGVLHMLLPKDGFALHASAANLDGKAVVFVGRSGAGKSTAIELLNKKHPALTDDLAVIRKQGDNYYLYQTPIVEKTWWIKKSKNPLPISMVCFLRKQLLPKTETIENRKYIFDRIVKQTWIIDESKKITIKNLFEFVYGFSDFRFLYFPKDEKVMMKFFSEKLRR